MKAAHLLTFPHAWNESRMPRWKVLPCCRVSGQCSVGSHKTIIAAPERQQTDIVHLCTDFADPMACCVAEVNGLVTVLFRRHDQQPGSRLCTLHRSTSKPDEASMQPAAITTRLTKLGDTTCRLCLRLPCMWSTWLWPRVSWLRLTEA